MKGLEGGVWAGAPFAQPSSSDREQGPQPACHMEEGREGGDGKWSTDGLEAQERNVNLIEPGPRVASSSSRPSVRKRVCLPLARPKAWHHALPVPAGPGGRSP